MTKASDLFIQCLEEEGVEYVFGVPGEENLDFLDSLSRSTKIKLILTRHEQGAGFMAATYGRHTGKAGVCLATLGPGRHQLRHRRRLCPAGRHADDDDHRPEADQELQAGPLPDPGRRRHDAAAHQVHPPARLAPTISRAASARPSAWPRKKSPARCISNSPKTSPTSRPTPRR